MTQYRIFPRYNVNQLKVSIHIEEFSDLNFKVSNISLNGIGIHLPRDIDFNEIVTISLKISTQSYTVIGHVIWKTWFTDRRTGQVGIQFHFENDEDYQRHLKTIKALHELRIKRTGQIPLFQKTSSKELTT